MRRRIGRLKRAAARVKVSAATPQLPPLSRVLGTGGHSASVPIQRCDCAAGGGRPGASEGPVPPLQENMPPLSAGSGGLAPGEARVQEPRTKRSGLNLPARRRAGDVVPVVVTAHPLGMGTGPYPLGGGGAAPPGRKEALLHLGCEPAVGAPLVCRGRSRPCSSRMLKWSS